MKDSDGGGAAAVVLKEGNKGGNFGSRRKQKDL